MRQRERNRDERPHAARPDSTPDHLDETRAAAERLLAAGGDVIERALSGDSRQFLRANQQSGGQ